MTDDKVCLRLFAEVADEAAAKATARAIESKLTAHGRIFRAYTKRNWKISEYFEVFFDLHTGERTDSAFEAILEVLGREWGIHRFADGGSWAVWSPSETAHFMLPEVRWANLECYSAASVDSTILILEDDQSRIDGFIAVLKSLAPTSRVICWRSARDMIQEVGPYLPRARLISLDHDLYPMAGDTADPGDGLEVAKFLAGRSVRCPIIIHSSNGDRARMMAGELELVGCPAKVIAPLGADWIEAYWGQVVRRLWDENRVEDQT